MEAISRFFEYMESGYARFSSTPLGSFIMALIGCAYVLYIGYILPSIIATNFYGWTIIKSGEAPPSEYVKLACFWLTEFVILVIAVISAFCTAARLGRLAIFAWMSMNGSYRECPICTTMNTMQMFEFPCCNKEICGHCALQLTRATIEEGKSAKLTLCCPFDRSTVVIAAESKEVYVLA